MNIKKTAVVDPAAAFAIRNGCWLVRVKYPASSLPLLVTVPLSVSTPAEVFRLTQDAALAESWAMNAKGG